MLMQQINVISYLYIFIYISLLLDFVFVLQMTLLQKIPN